MSIVDFKIFNTEKFTTEGFDTVQMDPFISEAEKKFLIPVLTQPLYDDIIQSRPLYARLIDNYITPCLRNLSASLAINKLAFDNKISMGDTRMREDLKADFIESGNFHLDELRKHLETGIYHFYLPADNRQMIAGFLVKPAVTPSWKLKPYAKAIITTTTESELYETDWADGAYWPEYIDSEWNYDFSAFLKSLGSFFIDWGDGSKPEEYPYYYSTCLHTYKEPGTYTITISGIYAFFQSSLVTEASLMFKLKRLNMAGCSSLTVNPVLTGLMFLQDLDLANTGITVPPVLTGLTGLKYLTLNNTAIVTPPILTDCPYITELELNCPSLTTPPDLTTRHYLQRFTINGSAINQAGLDSILETLSGVNFTAITFVNLRVQGSVTPTLSKKNAFIAAHPGCTLYTN